MNKTFVTVFINICYVSQYKHNCYYIVLYECNFISIFNC